MLIRSGAGFLQLNLETRFISEEGIVRVVDRKAQEMGNSEQIGEAL